MPRVLITVLGPSDWWQRAANNVTAGGKTAAATCSHRFLRPESRSSSFPPENLHVDARCLGAADMVPGVIWMVARGKDKPAVQEPLGRVLGIKVDKGYLLTFVCGHAAAHWRDMGGVA